MKQKRLLTPSDVEVAFMRCLYERCQTTYLHSLRVSWLVKALLPSLNLNGSGELLLMAAKLHDVGKIAVPDYVLKKKGMLNERQMIFMQSHSVIGGEILASLQLPQEYHQVEEGIRYHHEKYNGSGYPNGLKGKEIPFFARIIGVADFYAAVTENRPYKKAMPVRTVIHMLQERAGTEFDPGVVEMFCRLNVITLVSDSAIIEDSLLK